MSLLLSDPLAFLPAANSSPSNLRSLFHQWNQTASGHGTFNRPDAEQLDQLTVKMDAHQKDRSAGARKIKTPTKSQLVEPIPVLDMDHPLNSWMLPSGTDHLGPLATKNSTDWPVLPQFTVSALSNGTLVQIPVSCKSQRERLSNRWNKRRQSVQLAKRTALKRRRPRATAKQMNTPRD